jgi:hypothetical protein
MSCAGCRREREPEEQGWVVGLGSEPARYRALCPECVSKLIAAGGEEEHAEA